jgi:mRNA interferase RelE/StbE
MYEIVLTETATKDLKKLDNNIKFRIKNKLIKFKNNPLYYSKKLSDFKIGSYRFRIGDYRVIFDIDNASNTIVILRIGHRKNIYK